MPDRGNTTDTMEAATRQSRLERENKASGTRTLGVAPAGLFSFHTPEPPTIHVPLSTDGISAPTFDGLCGDQITEADLRIITRRNFTPQDNSARWGYEMRRQAQQVLPFLYLGPWEVLKTQMEFLHSEEISMLLVVRDTATARAGIMNPKKYADTLGILYDSIDVQNNQELIMAFPHAIKIINDHLLSCYRQQVQAAGVNLDSGETAFRMCKVFLYCESGNDRSAAIAVAYILAMYNVSLVFALQFIQAQRFCISIDEDVKRLLSAYEDILKAQRDVHSAKKQITEVQEQVPFQTRASDMMHRSSNPATKRGRSTDEDGDMCVDEERFEGRSGFQPFVQEY